MPNTDKLPDGPAPARSLAAILAHLYAGGEAYVATYTRVTILNRKALARFEKCGAKLLWEEGDGYRLASGKKSVYLFPGQLTIGMYNPGAPRPRPTAAQVQATYEEAMGRS